MATIIKKGVVDRSKFKGRLLFIDKEGNLASSPMKRRRKKKGKNRRRR